MNHVTDRPAPGKEGGHCSPVGLVAVLVLYLCGFALQMFLRGHADDWGRPTVSGQALEHFVLHGLSPLWLQRWTPDIAAIQWLAVAFHTSWFYVPPALVILVYVRLGTRAAIEIVLLELAVFYSADLFYAFLPTRPPWMDLHVTRVVEVAYGARASIDSNPVASIPSLHVALPMMFTVWFWRQPGRVLRGLTPVLLGWTVGVAWSAVYGAEHYFVGALAGAAWGAAVVWIATYPRGWVPSLRAVPAPAAADPESFSLSQRAYSRDGPTTGSA